MKILTQTSIFAFVFSLFIGCDSPTKDKLPENKNSQSSPKEDVLSLKEVPQNFRGDWILDDMGPGDGILIKKNKISFSDSSGGSKFSMDVSIFKDKKESNMADMGAECEVDNIKKSGGELKVICSGEKLLPLTLTMKENNNLDIKWGNLHGVFKLAPKGFRDN